MVTMFSLLTSNSIYLLFVHDMYYGYTIYIFMCAYTHVYDELFVPARYLCKIFLLATDDILMSFFL